MNVVQFIDVWLPSYAGICLLILIIPHSRRWLKRFDVMITGCVAGLIMMAPMIFCALAVVQPVLGRSVRISIPSQTVAEVNLDSWKGWWRWDPRLDKQKNRWVSLAGWDQRVTMKLSPITDNPKVRDLKYSIEWDLPADTDLATWNILIHELSGDDPQTYVQRQLYEFDEHNSRELAKFYNPLDEAQQTKFRQLVEGFMRPVFERTQLKLRKVRFYA